MFELSIGGYVVRLQIASSKSVKVDLPLPKVSWIEDSSDADGSG
jgi:hypothetical protein